MREDRLHQPIKELLQRNGAMGVNQLQKELGIPLSTLQQYLDKRQSYFKKNSARKWVLPEDLAEVDKALVSDSYVDIIDAQLKSIDVLFETLTTQFRSTLTLMDANRAPVAGKTPNVDKRLIEIQENSETTRKVFKKYIDKVPDKYQDLLLNTDILGIMVDKGKEYVNGPFNAEISSLLLERSDELSSEVLEVLEKYQKGA